MRSGAITLSSANDRNALATYGGVIGCDTPVLVVENRTGKTVACAALNEGRGRALRYGANDAQTLARLAWLENEFATVLSAALRLSGGIDVFEILVQALHMGDDGHSRQKAASALLLNAVEPWLLESGQETRAIAGATRFMAQNDIFSTDHDGSREIRPRSGGRHCRLHRGHVHVHERRAIWHQGERCAESVVHRTVACHSRTLSRKLSCRGCQPRDW